MYNCQQCHNISRRFLSQKKLVLTEVYKVSFLKCKLFGRLFASMLSEAPTKTRHLDQESQVKVWITDLKPVCWSELNFWARITARELVFSEGLIHYDILQQFESI